MEIKNIKKELEKAPVDKNAGIRVIKMTGNSEISIFAAEIAPKTQLNPHYHKNGIETYQILEGRGKMKIGDLTDNVLKWEAVFDTDCGDFFSIQEGKVHQIINESDEPLIAIFTCQEAHLSTDRFFI